MTALSFDEMVAIEYARMFGGAPAETNNAREENSPKVASRKITSLKERRAALTSRKPQMIVSAPVRVPVSAEQLATLQQKLTPPAPVAPTPVVAPVVSETPQVSIKRTAVTGKVGSVTLVVGPRRIVFSDNGYTDEQWFTLGDMIADGSYDEMDDDEWEDRELHVRFDSENPEEYAQTPTPVKAAAPVVTLPPAPVQATAAVTTPPRTSKAADKVCMVGKTITLAADAQLTRMSGTTDHPFMYALLVGDRLLQIAILDPEWDRDDFLELANEVRSGDFDKWTHDELIELNIVVLKDISDDAPTPTQVAVATALPKLKEQDRIYAKIEAAYADFKDASSKAQFMSRYQTHAKNLSPEYLLHAVHAFAAIEPLDYDKIFAITE